MPVELALSKIYIERGVLTSSEATVVSCGVHVFLHKSFVFVVFGIVRGGGGIQTLLLIFSIFACAYKHAHI